LFQIRIIKLKAAKDSGSDQNSRGLITMLVDTIKRNHRHDLGIPLEWSTD